MKTFWIRSISISKSAIPSINKEGKTAEVKTWKGLAILVSLALVLALGIVAVPMARADEATGAQVLEAYGGLPISFIQNQGQLDARVEYYVKADEQTLYLTGENVVFDLIRYEGAEEADLADRKAQRLVYSLDFLGANKSPVIEGRDKDKAIVNYFIGNDPEKWHSNIPTYREVVYKDIYPGIDLRLYGKEGLLEYEFVVEPGASVAEIRLAYDGVDSVVIEDGELVASTAFGDMKQTPPYIYQQIGDDEAEVDGGFKLISSNIYGFEVAAYDASYPLIIDPGLAYSTYLGGNDFDNGQAIAIESGFAYVTGLTGSTDFPTKNQYQTDPGDSNYDGFVAKMDTTKSGLASLIYCTYLGGNASEYGKGIAVESGCAYVTGQTDSTNFPTLNQYETDDSLTDAFVTKLNASGNNIAYSTYLGGNSYDRGYGITVKSGYAYVTGFTSSTNFPTKNPYQTNQGGDDGFVAKIDPTQSGNDSLIYSTYLGGSHNDWGQAIAVESGCAYVTGGTWSTNFPTTPATRYQGDQGESDSFVTKLNTTGNGLVYSTYLGGTTPVTYGYGRDYGYGIAVESGCAYVTGQTGSSDFPTRNQYQTSQPYHDAFVTKIDTGLSGNASLVYSTYLGGNETESGYGIAVESGCAYATGETKSTDFPTRDEYQTHQGGEDAFVTKIDTTKSGDASLIYSTYLGGNGEDHGAGIAVESGCAYVIGRTESTGFPTKNQYMTDPGDSNSDAFVTKLCELAPHTVTLTAAPINIAADGSSTSLLTAAVEDQLSDPVSDGTDVVFDTNHGTLGSSTVTKQTSGGVATATLTSEWSIETLIATVTATANGASDATAVFFIPAGGAEVVESQTETITGSGTMTDTPTGGDVSIEGTGEHTITVATYERNPRRDPGFAARGDFYDIHLDDDTGVESLTIEFCPATPWTLIWYWDGSRWRPASDQHYSGGCRIVTVTDSTFPSLSDLTGLVFAPGTSPQPPPGVPTVNHWGIVTMVTLLAGLLVWTVRRRLSTS